MQVNNVQNSPNFGMGLIVKKGARQALKMATDAERKQVSKYGEELSKGFEYFDVYLREGLEPVVRNKKTGAEIRGPFEAVFEPKNGALTVVAQEADPHSTKGLWGRILFPKLYFKNTKAAQSAKDTLNKSSGIAAAVEYAKMAEESEKLLAAHPIVARRGRPYKGSIDEIIANLNKK